MARNYHYAGIRISDLLLDEENPRFASSALVKGNAVSVSQEAIMGHLLRHDNIIGLAQRINSVEELHGSELITCYPVGDKYVVLEGNRRVCACKLLLDRSLIPDKYKASYPFIADETKENIELIQACIYPDRQSVQSFLSDRHITGVKKWSALEKNNYYMNLFQECGSITEVKKYTSDSEATIRNSIKKYQFFIDVFTAIRSKHSDIVIEDLDYLPMVDRFMGLIVGDDSEVGLNLQFDDTTLKYSCIDIGKTTYSEILLLVGEAFLLRKEQKFCENGELSKIISPEIKNIETQKKLILENERIPGLIELVQQYKALCSNKPDEDASQSSDNDAASGTSDNQGNNPDDDNNGNSDDGDNTSGNDNGQAGGAGGGHPPDDGNKYIPPAKYRPKKSAREFLMFSPAEASSFKIGGVSDYEEKIKEIIRDLATLSVYDHPYACAMLYRSLLEVCTRFVYDRYASSISKSFDENDLAGSMLNLNNNVLFVGKATKDIPKIRDTIKANLSKTNIINILNLYIHYSNPVDEQLLLSSWNTMKFYLIACLSK